MALRLLLLPGMNLINIELENLTRWGRDKIDAILLTTFKCIFLNKD